MPKPDNTLDNEQYIAELEKLVIWLAGAYTAGYESVSCREDGKGGVDDRFMNILMTYPTIQGTENRIFVKRIGSLRTKRHNQEAPGATWNQIFERISKGREEPK